MIKYISIILFIMGLNPVLFSYEVGDTVENFTFDDITFFEGGNSVSQRDLYDIIDSGKPVIIYFETVSYS